MVVEVKGFEIDVQEALNQLMEHIPLEVELQTVTVVENKFIKVICKPFKRGELGVFSHGLKECTLTTFTSSVSQSTTTERWQWYSSWVLSYEICSGGRNCIEIANILYDIDTKEWIVRTER